MKSILLAHKRVISSKRNSHSDQSGPSGTSSITGITGTIAHNSTITIIGSGFGSMGGDLLQYIRGDERAPGQPIHGTVPNTGNRNVSTYVIGIGSDTSGQVLSYSSDTARPGRATSCKRQRTAGSAASGGFGFNGLTNEPYCYVSFWRRGDIDEPYVPEDINFKIFYLFANGSNNSNQAPQAILHVPQGQTSIIVNPNDAVSSNNRNNNQGWDFESCFDGNWYFWEGWMKLSTAIGLADGTLKFARNGVVGIEDNAYEWQYEGQDTLATSWEDWRIGYMEQYSTTPTIRSYYNDVYYATTPAGVWISTSPTWDPAAPRERVIVTSANWSDTQITGTLDIGQFSSFAGKYLYIIKADGLPFSTTGVLVQPVAPPQGQNGVSVSGNVITITGSDFPTRTRAAPVIWDNFAGMTQGQAIYQRTPPVLNANVSTYWSADYGGAENRPRATLIGNRVPGKPCAHHPISNTTYTCALTVRHLLPQNTSAPLYLAFWWKSEPTGDNRQVKPCAFYGNQPPDNMYPSFYIGMGNYESFPDILAEDGINNYGAIDDDMRTSFQDDDIPNIAHRGLVSWSDIIGRFVKIELVLVQSTPGVADGMYACRIYDPYAPGGPTKYETIRHNIATRDAGIYSWRSYDIGSYGGGFQGREFTCPVWTDDPIMDDGANHARIVLGNSSDYSQCTIVEDQPATSWSSNEIVCTANRSAFTSGQNAYLFLVTGAGHSGHGSATLLGTVPVP